MFLRNKEAAVMKKRLIPAIILVPTLLATFYLVWFRIINGPHVEADAKLLAALGDSRIMRALEEPRPLPDISFINGDGRNLRLSDFAGKVVLLNIWATWCFPCREEMPSLDRLQARLGGPDFQVLPVSTDEGGIKAVRAFYKAVGIESLGVFVDPTGKTATDLKILGYPTTLLLDRKGRALGVKLGPAEWDSEEVITLIQSQINGQTIMAKQL